MICALSADYALNAFAMRREIFSRSLRFTALKLETYYLGAQFARRNSLRTFGKKFLIAPLMAMAFLYKDIVLCSVARGLAVETDEKSRTQWRNLGL